MYIKKIKRNLRRFIVFAGCIMAGTAARGQSTNFQAMLSEANNFYQSNVREKIFIHTDRDFYLAGDILWLKAYVQDARDNKPLALSKVGYVELLNAERDPILQAKISLSQGSGSGSLHLPSSIQSGNYELRAYTNWMKNDSSSLYFQKFITVINTLSNLDTSTVDKSPLYRIHVFPEGGNLVNDLSSVVGIKINDNTGHGIAANGFVISGSQDTVASFRSNFLGMGHFSLIPRKGESYRAIVNFSGGRSTSATLPEAYNSGYVMHLSDESDGLKVTVTSAGETSQNLYLIAETRRKIGFSGVERTENSSATFLIDKNKLQEGMAHLTLFDDNGQALCERLYFKRPLTVLNINARLNKNVFSKRDKVTIDVATSDKNNPIAANMSAAVYRLDGLHAADDREILSYLWLSSEVRGYIENPDYYFSKNDVQTNADLDDLLLTQGWRTFDWHSASTNNRRPVYVPENRGHIVTGKVTNDITGQPAENILVYLSVPGRRVQLYGCLSDAHGIVHFDLQDFYGPSQLVMQTNTQVDSIYRLEVLSPFSESPAGAAFPAFRISEKTRDELSAANLSLAVQEAYHKNELSKMEEPQIDSLPFYYRPTKTYLLDNYTRFTTMEEVLREYVIEVNVLRRKKEYHLNVFNEQGFLLQNLQPSQKIFEKDPLILLDGVPVFNVDKLIAYDPLKVQKLEVVADKYYWGPITAYGITSFTTYQGNLPGFTLNPHDIIIDYDGLQKQRIFYAPDYSSQKVLQSHLPDFRDLLYWSPNVKTDASGAGSLSFYTSDVPGKYVVVLQGISPNGDAGSQQAMFEVTK